MSKSEKGKKGFQSKNPDEVKTKRIVSYLSESELSKFKDYCSKENKNMSVIIRELILEKLS